VFYDIGASPEARSVDVAWIERIARLIDIPFCVAGGIDSVETARRVLFAGADKVSINSPALGRPELITELADEFGVQCVVVGVDSVREPMASGGCAVSAATRTRPRRCRCARWTGSSKHNGGAPVRSC
jgi:imidazole glycerol phosphate synthase subunit HisF